MAIRSDDAATTASSRPLSAAVTTGTSRSSTARAGRASGSALSRRAAVAIASARLTAPARSASTCARASSVARSPPTSGTRRERRRVDAGQLQLAQRPGDGARKSRQIGDRREVRQLARLVRIEGSARGNGFGAQRAAGRDQPFGQNRQCQPHRQLGERHPRHADQRAAVAGEGEGEFVGRGAGGADDQHAAVGVGLDERARRAQAHRGRRIDDDGIPARRHGGPVVEDRLILEQRLAARG